MGFTKIYKLTSNEVGYCKLNYGTVSNIAILPVSFKGITGRTYNGIADHPMIPTSTTNSSLARPLLLGLQSNNAVPTTTTVSGDANTYLDIGFGDTVETDEDYCLASPYSNGNDFTLSHANTENRIYGGDKISFSVPYTIHALNDLTIREIGIFTRVLNTWSAYNSLSYSEGVLMYRKVLDTPLTISAGNSATIVLSIAAG